MRSSSAIFAIMAVSLWSARADIDNAIDIDEALSARQYDPVRTMALSKVALGFLTHALRQLDFHSSDTLLKKWLGDFGTIRKAEVKQVLNSGMNVLQNVRYEYPGPACSIYGVGLTGYVYPYGETCSGSLGSGSDIKHCRFDAQGKYVIYLCTPYSERDDGAMTEIIIARSLMHHSAYLVPQCSERNPPNPCQFAYTREQCANLATIDSHRAMKNPENFAYFVHAVADPNYPPAVASRESPLVLPPQSPRDSKTTSHQGFSAYSIAYGSIIILLVTISAYSIAYGFGVVFCCCRERCKKSTRRVASDMEFQEAFQTQRAHAVHV